MLAWRGRRFPLVGRLPDPLSFRSLFLEKITHFDRERIPERVVHARGSGAHGSFEATGQIGNDPSSTFTRAKLFQEAG